MKIRRESLAFRSLLLASLIFVGGAFALKQDEIESHEQRSQFAASNNQRKGLEKGFVTKLLDDPTAFFTAALAFLTLVLATTGAVQVVFLRRTDESARRSADAAKEAANVARDTLIAGNRAWIKVEIIFDEYCQLLEGSDGINASLKILLRNIGNSPALNVFTHIWLFAETGLADSIEWRDRKCEEVRSTPTKLGISLFPNEQSPEVDNTTIEVFGGTRIPTKYVELGIKRSGDLKQNGVAVRVLGCVNYRITVDGAAHQTRFCYDFNGSRGAFIPLEDMSNMDTMLPRFVRPHRVSLCKPPFGIGQYAD